jgi:hypothetical protein
MSKQRKKDERKAAQRAAARDNTDISRPAPAAARISRQAPSEPKNTRALTFGKDTYLWMGIGFALVILGLLLMSGGRGDDPTVFDESVIYSFRKITLAPIVMLAGLGTVIYAVLKK